MQGLLNGWKVFGCFLLAMDLFAKTSRLDAGFQMVGGRVGATVINSQQISDIFKFNLSLCSLFTYIKATSLVASD